MERAGCIEMMYPELEDKVVVTIMGASAQELYNLGHRENFFYLQHAMGLASSIGLGLATHLPNERVVVLDGDGSVLMNLGTFVTLARYRPKNMIHVVFDNGSLLSTGGFDSQTASGVTDIAARLLAASRPAGPKLSIGTRGPTKRRPCSAKSATVSAAAKRQSTKWVSTISKPCATQSMHAASSARVMPARGPRAKPNITSGSSRGATKRASETLAAALSTRSVVVSQTGPQIGAKTP